MKSYKIIILLINSLIILLFNLLINELINALVITPEKGFLIVPPFKYTCINITFYNNENVSHVISILPEINKSVLPYFLGSRLSANYFSLFPHNKRVITLCFKPTRFSPPLITNYKLKVYLDGNFYKFINLTLWYNYYYDFKVKTLVLPPKLYHSKVYLLINLLNSGNLNDTYELRIYLNEKLVKDVNISLTPGNIKILHYELKPDSIIVNLRIVVKSLKSVKRYEKTYKLIRIYYPYEILFLLFEKVRKLKFI